MLVVLPSLQVKQSVKVGPQLGLEPSLVAEPKRVVLLAPPQPSLAQRLQEARQLPMVR